MRSLRRAIPRDRREDRPRNSRSAPTRAASGTDGRPSSIIGWSSRGGPGRSNTSLMAAREHLPGRRAIRVVEDRRRPGSPAPACDSLPASCSPRRSNRSFRRSAIAASSIRRQPSTSATASRVTSSSVGPRPPVKMTRSTRSRRGAGARSPRGGCRRRRSSTCSSIPSDDRRSARNSELVSSRVDPSSSLPIGDDLGRLQSGLGSGRHATHWRQDRHQQSQRRCLRRSPPSRHPP